MDQVFDCVADSIDRLSWPFASTRVSGAVLVNASTLGLWQLLEIATVVIARTTGVQAFLFGCRSRRERFKTGVARIECVNARQQKDRKEERDDGKRPLAGFHCSNPFRSKKATSGTTSHAELNRRNDVSSCGQSRSCTFVCTHRVCSLTTPSSLASVCSTCSKPAPISDCYTRNNLSERVRRQRAGRRGTRCRLRKPMTNACRHLMFSLWQVQHLTAQF